MRLRNTIAVQHPDGQVVIITALTGKLTERQRTVLAAFRWQCIGMADLLAATGRSRRSLSQVLGRCARMGLVHWGWDTDEEEMVRLTDTGNAVRDMLKEPVKH